MTEGQIVVNQTDPPLVGQVIEVDPYGYPGFVKVWWWDESITLEQAEDVTDA